MQGDGVEMVSYDSRNLSLKVRMSAPGYLVVADTFYPGWQAYVDGQARPVLRANWLFRALELPAGEHSVEMRYEPAFWGAGWLLALLAVVGLGVLGFALPHAPESGNSSWRAA